MGYVISVERSTDSRLVFWGPGNCGYTEDHDEAGYYDAAAVAADRDYYDNGMTTLFVEDLAGFLELVRRSGLAKTVKEIVAARTPAPVRSAIPTQRPDKDALRQHCLDGVGDYCLVCDERLYGQWTDYNGQIKCSVCGMTYQILGCHLREDYLSELGISKEQVAKRYCDSYQAVPLCRDYWQQEYRKIPFGTFLGHSGGAITREDAEAFWNWLRDNADKYRPEYEEDFRWDAIVGEPATVE